MICNAIQPLLFLIKKLGIFSDSFLDNLERHYDGKKIFFGEDN